MLPELVDISPAEHRRLSELLAALRTPLEVSISHGSWLVDSAFAEEFQSRILAQHVFMRNVLFQDSFEAAFVGAARCKGATIHSAPAGQRFWDVEMDGKRISLKSSKARDLKLHQLHVSKLTEAAWIQDCRTARSRMDRVKSLFVEYIDTVHSIIQLRYFRSTQSYELVEVPVSMLKAILDLTLDSFNGDGPSIDIPVGQTPPDLTLKLDRSDSKITLARIAKAKCCIHGTWRICNDSRLVD